MSDIFIQDFNELPSSFEIDDSTGFVTLTGNIARVGIQEYRGYELGKKGDSTVYKVLRPLEVVKDSVTSFLDKPITIEHQGLVTIKNSAKHQKGYIKDSWFDDATGWHKAKEVINHPDGINAIVNDGYRWHSCGYTASIKWEPGESEYGVYDASFSKIKGNHNALVKNPRAGDLATFDSQDKDDIIIKEKDSKVISMSKKYQVTLLDSAMIELEGDHAPDIHKLITTLQTEKTSLETIVTDSNSKIKSLEEKVATLTTEKETIQGKLDGLQLIGDSKPVNESAKERAEWFAVYDSVKALVTDSPYEKTVRELKVAAIKASKNIDLSDKSDDYVAGIFDSIKDSLTVTDAKTVDPVSVLKDTKQNDSSSFALQVNKEYKESIENAWK